MKKSGRFSDIFSYIYEVEVNKQDKNEKHKKDENTTDK
jgi:hypothetical protein